MPGGHRAIYPHDARRIFLDRSDDVNFETTGVALDVSALGDATTYATTVARMACATGSFI
eukprot:3537796-Pyramimonas_sp.AAC.1